jgi:hypothetical protein
MKKKRETESFFLLKHERVQAAGTQAVGEKISFLAETLSKL